MPAPEVPVICPGGTVVCLASGPSLTVGDVNYCRERADAVIAINNTYQLAPWATALYAADAHWWDWHKGVPSFAGLKYCLQDWVRFPDVQVLKNTGEKGLETDPTGLRTGKNSGYQAINLAVHLGAKRIILLGYDLQAGPNGETHWHGDHVTDTGRRVSHQQHWPTFLYFFQFIVEPLKQLGVEVINCSPRSLLEVFPKMPLTEAFS